MTSEYSVGGSPPPMQDETQAPVYAAPVAQQLHPGASGSGGANAAPASDSAAQLPWPPGFAGMLAECIHENSFIQIPQISITAALALLAGVCGRGFRTHTGKDLALYIMLVARSGIGKDAIHEGIPRLIELAKVPGAERIARRDNFASGPALHKALLSEPGFLNLQGEVGRKLKQMADPKNGVMQDLRTILTNAYAKDFLEGKAYSNAEQSLQGVPFPALSFLGETTPGTFLESLTLDMMEDGFLSRFLVISYEGERPPSNPDRVLYMDEAWLQYWRALLAYATNFLSPINCPAPITVIFKNNDAYERLERFEEECRQFINASTDESVRAVHNRAHLKTLKIASILAAADCAATPRIDLGHAVWAITAVRHDTEVFLRRKKAGDVGNDDHTRQAKLLTILREYAINGAAASYKIPRGMHPNGIVPRKYLQMRTASLPTFTSHRLGASAVLDIAVRGLLDGGYIKEVDKISMADNYNFHGKCYLILNLPD